MNRAQPAGLILHCGAAVGAWRMHAPRNLAHFDAIPICVRLPREMSSIQAAVVTQNTVEAFLLDAAHQLGIGLVVGVEFAVPDD